MSARAAAELRTLARLPSDAGAKERLEYVKQLVMLLQRVPDARIRGLRRKLDEALVELATQGSRTNDAALARKLGARLEGLRRDTLELVLLLTNQARGTLRVKAASNPASDGASEQLRDGLAAAARGLRSLVQAARDGDPGGEARAARALASDLEKLTSTKER